MLTPPFRRACVLRSCASSAGMRVSHLNNLLKSFALTHARIVAARVYMHTANIGFNAFERIEEAPTPSPAPLP